MMPYKHIVQYYETDKMGITHHSNYIRFMEEARIDFLKQIGWEYGKLEEQGVISPVVSVNCDYKRPSTFADEIEIFVGVEDITRVKLVIAYTMTVKDAVICKAQSSHCFVSDTGKPVSIEKQCPELYEVLLNLCDKKFYKK